MDYYGFPVVCLWNCLKNAWNCLPYLLSTHLQYKDLWYIWIKNILFKPVDKLSSIKFLDPSTKGHLWLIYRRIFGFINRVVHKLGTFSRKKTTYRPLLWVVFISLYIFLFYQWSMWFIVYKPFHKMRDNETVTSI